ncbi:MAG: TerC/Alx family metal homeostasis membrane protein [Gemmatimonadales bacterium]
MIAGQATSMWLVFIATIATLLAVDLGVVHRRVRAARVRDAAWWCLAVVVAAVLFGVLVWWHDGRDAAVRFASGYVVEISLSVDNLLVFILLLRYFAVPPELQPTVIQWGILGAIVLRAIVVAVGAILLHELNWVIYLLGGVLIFTGLRMLRRDVPQGPEPERNLVLRAGRRFLPMTERFHDGALVVREGGRWVATPLLLVVLVVEWTDLIFATDSIPAIFAITRNPFLVYTSNIFAVAGLRALFFVLAGTLARFSNLRWGVAVVLLFVGVKMLIRPWVQVTPEVSLAVIAGVLCMSVLASIRAQRTRHAS